MMTVELRTVASQPRQELSVVRERPKSTGWIVPLCDALGVIVALAVTAPGWKGLATGVAVALAVLLVGEAFQPRLVLSALTEMPRMLGRVGLAAALVGLGAAELGWIDRPLVSLAAVMAAFAIGRCLTFALLRFLRRSGTGLNRTLIVGGGETASNLRRVLNEHPEFGLEVAGAIDQEASSLTDLVDTLDVLPLQIALQGVDRVIIAYGKWNDQIVVDVIRKVADAGVELYVVPRLFEAGGAGGDPRLEDVMGVPLLWLRRRSCRTWQLRKKRAFDLVVTSTAVLMLSPLLALLAALVKLSSPGPVLFRQLRIGRNGKEFELLKFRSMRVNNDSDTTWTVANDTRVTKLGKLLRKSSLDELPQLLNILRGDMSLVGPRPERPFYVEQFAQVVPHYHARHRGPVGLTGLAQVNGLRGDTPIDDRVRVDNSYIDQWSMWGDIVIIVRTFSAAFKGL